MEALWPARPANRGRVFESSRRVRLADTGADGAVRLDAIARYLQDVATDDSDEAGFPTGPGSGHVWVVRHTGMRLIDGAGWPTLGERIELATWCGGIGRAWATRRTDIAIDGQVRVETSALWVHLDGSGRPARLDASFLAAYGPAAAGRVASARVPPPPARSARASGMPWTIRAADLDIIGHVNNAAVWAAMVEAAGPARARTAEVVHHGPLEAGDRVELWVEATDGGRRVWLTVDGDARASGRLA